MACIIEDIICVAYKFKKMLLACSRSCHNRQGYAFSAYVIFYCVVLKKKIGLTEIWFATPSTRI